MNSSYDAPVPPATFEFLVMSLRAQVELQLGLVHFGASIMRHSTHQDAQAVRGCVSRPKSVHTIQRGPDKPLQARIRGRTLQAIIARLLRANPLCVRCMERGRPQLAVEVDHIVALCNGGTETDDNRQGLCRDCHRQKSREDLGQKAMDGCGVDGVPSGWK